MAASMARLIHSLQLYGILLFTPGREGFLDQPAI